AVDPSELLLRLLRPFGLGDLLADRVRWLGVSCDVGLRLRLQVEGAPLWIDVQPLAEVERYAACSRSFAFTYRTEGDRRPFDGAKGQALCRRIAAIAEANEAAMLHDLEVLSTGRASPPRIRRLHVSQALEPAGDDLRPHYTLSPYVGCTIGCGYCYAHRQLKPLRRLLRLPQAPWGSYIDIRDNLPEVLAAELLRLPPRPIKLCPIVSDPYQPIEAQERLTRRTLEVIAAAPAIWPTLLLTRSTLLLDDLSLLQRLSRVAAGVSLPTVDDRVRRHFEPRAASVEQRLALLEDLKAAGIATHAVVQPILPGSVDELADALARATDSVSIDVLRGEGEATAEFRAATVEQCSDAKWQLARALELRTALERRGVAVWRGELPPDL
ncbi:MAG TPA: radical SAM protein, partial [Nannocystis exedens]|nr:radical SAM protein [Nannocystis exedens]